VTVTRQICIVLAISVAGCAIGTDEIEPFVDNSKSDGHPPKLHAIDDHKLHVDEPSDLTLAADRLYTVSDAHSKIYGLSDDGDVDSEIDIDGHDLEALTFDPQTGEFVIADESKARVWHIDASGTRRDPIDIADAEDGNSGIEGLTYDDEHHLVIGKEKDPARVFVYDGTTEIDRKKLGWISDLSALAWHDGHLWVLSDEDRALFEVNADYEVEVAWRLPIDKPEGLAFYGSYVYVCSDSEQRIYVFDLEDP